MFEQLTSVSDGEEILLFCIERTSGEVYLWNYYLGKWRPYNKKDEDEAKKVHDALIS